MVEATFDLFVFQGFLLSDEEDFKFNQTFFFFFLPSLYGWLEVDVGFPKLTFISICMI